MKIFTVCMPMLCLHVAHGFNHARPALHLRGGVVHASVNHVRPALRLRGGAVRTFGAYTSGQQMAPAVPQQAPAGERDRAMSDAERIFVLQQFERQEVRKAFLQKVYGILFAQVTATGLVMALLRASPGAALAVLGKLGYLVILLPLVPLFWLQMSHAARTTAPQNYLLLGSFTLLQGLALGVATLPFATSLVLRAAGVTAVATGGLTVYAMQTKRDFTAKGGLLSAGLLALVASSLLQLFVGGSWLASAQTGFGVLLFCAYIVYNTQLMTGGGKKAQLRPDEHVLGALTLYVDVINLFMYLLRSMSERER